MKPDENIFLVLCPLANLKFTLMSYANDSSVFNMMLIKLMGSWLERDSRYTFVDTII